MKQVCMQKDSLLFAVLVLYGLNNFLAKRTMEVHTTSPGKIALCQQCDQEL
jgi:hypothetical protein